MASGISCRHSEPRRVSKSREPLGHRAARTRQPRGRPCTLQRGLGALQASVFSAKPAGHDPWGIETPGLQPQLRQREKPPPLRCRHGVLRAPASGCLYTDKHNAGWESHQTLTSGTQVHGRGKKAQGQQSPWTGICSPPLSIPKLKTLSCDEVWASI